MVRDGSGRPGAGGISRGRGDAQMSWGEESEGRSDLFTPEALPDARVMDMESSAVLGVGAVAPREDAQGGASGLVDVEGSSGKSAWKRRLAPRHRDAVHTFFSPAGTND